MSAVRDLCAGGVYLASTEDGTVTIWPREVYPSVDDVITAMDEGGFGSRYESEEDRFRIAWANCDDYGWWWWWGVPLGGVECWEVSS